MKLASAFSSALPATADPAPTPELFLTTSSDNCRVMLSVRFTSSFCSTAVSSAVTCALSGEVSATSEATTRIAARAVLRGGCIGNMYPSPRMSLPVLCWPRRSPLAFSEENPTHEADTFAVYRERGRRAVRRRTCPRPGAWRPARGQSARDAIDGAWHQRD